MAQFAQQLLRISDGFMCGQQPCGYTHTNSCLCNGSGPMDPKVVSGRGEARGGLSTLFKNVFHVFRIEMFGNKHISNVLSTIFYWLFSDSSSHLTESYSSLQKPIAE